jgi:Family of unknown function (DUF6338)
MKVFETIGSATGEQVLTFVVLILPGFISLQVYYMRRGGEARKMNEALLDVIVYSFMTDLIVLGGFAAIAATLPIPAQPAAKIIFGASVVVVFPAALAFAWVELQHRLIRWGIINESAPRLLEGVLDRAIRERVQLGVIVTLRDGRKVGGRVSAPAYTRSRATHDEVLLGEVWTLDQDSARF